MSQASPILTRVRALLRRPPGSVLIPVVALLWLIWLIRAHNALQLPIFVDESLHIMRGQVVWQFSDLGESLTPKKLLYYYWIGLFGLNAPESAWLARTATALVALPGAALTFALARQLFDQRAGLLALLLYTLAPFLVFFERLALADAFTATLGTAVMLAGLGLARRPSIQRGVLAGALVGLAVLAKLTALPLIALPVLAIALYGHPPGIRLTPGQAIRAPFAPRYRRPVLAGALACALVLAPSLIYVAAQEIGGNRARVVVEESLYTTDDRLAQITDNAGRAFRASLTLLGPELIALGGALTAYLAWRRPRALTYLLAGTFLPWAGVILVSAVFSTRYLVPGIPPLLVLIAGGAVDAARWVARHRGGVIEPNWKPVSRLYWITWIALALWMFSFAVPFIRDALNDPTRLSLPERDRWEYFTHSSSGYGLRDLAADLPRQEPGPDGRITVIGFLPNCHSLPLYWPRPNPVDLDCPLFKWNTTRQDEMYNYLVGRVASEPIIYMAVDQTGAFDVRRLPFEWTLLNEYPRPFDGKTVQLFRVNLSN